MSCTSWLRIHILRRANRTTHVARAVAAALAAITFTASVAPAAYVTVYGGPIYAPGVGGFQGGGSAGVNDAGAAVGAAEKFDGNGANLGYRALRWDSSGTAATELGNLGTNSSGVTSTGARAINSAGTAVGYATKYNASGVGQRDRAVRWDGSGAAATELGHLGTSSSGDTFSDAWAINDAGTAVGRVNKYDSGVSRGMRAVRWDALGTVATELGHLGTAANGSTGPSGNIARAINNAGSAVGSAIKFDISGANKGFRAVRWDGTGTAATELGNLGTDTNGATEGIAWAINDAGTTVGWASKYDGTGAFKGARAVRWDASGAAATELGILSASAFGNASSFAQAINDAGAAVGWAYQYESDTELFERAVRWDASGAVTALGHLGTSVFGWAQGNAYAVNAAGIAVGWTGQYDDSGAGIGQLAVYWGLDGMAVDLNTLIDPASGWTLDVAHDIGDTGWIGGIGTFDPDGPGGEDAYARLFLMQVPPPSNLPGDFNHDGTVDAADYATWRNGLGTTYTQGDYATWRANFGRTAGSGAGATADLPSSAVPEPASFTLLLLASSGWLWLCTRTYLERRSPSLPFSLSPPSYPPFRGAAENRC